jgi:hypothetical protein
VSASASFEAALAAGRASAAEALALFDALGPVATTDLRGGWAGRGFPTGHPLDGVLAAWHWHGKRFESDDAVDPLVMRTRAGALLPIDPTWARPLLPLWTHWRWLASPAVARLAAAAAAAGHQRPAGAPADAGAPRLPHGGDALRHVAGARRVPPCRRRHGAGRHGTARPAAATVLRAAPRSAGV